MTQSKRHKNLKQNALLREKLTVCESIRNLIYFFEIFFPIHPSHQETLKKHLFGAIRNVHEGESGFTGLRGLKKIEFSLLNIVHTFRKISLCYGKLIKKFH
jgi:hypothetical protein